MAPKHPVVVVGGSNLDIIASTYQNTRLQDSNPGYVRFSHGGVGRNIAENLGRLRVPALFITVTGQDKSGRAIAEELTRLGVAVDGAIASQTSSYVAVHDKGGDMVVAVNDMEAMEALNTNVIESFIGLISKAAVVVIDANIPGQAIAMILRAHPRVIIDGVSTAKVKRLEGILDRIHTLKLNKHEAGALVDVDIHDIESAKEATKELLHKGIKRVYLTMGEAGVVVGDDKAIVHHPAIYVHPAKANGAGDAFTAGLVYGRYHGIEEVEAALELARLTLEVDEAVNPNLEDKIDDWLTSRDRR